MKKGTYQTEQRPYRESRHVVLLPLTKRSDVRGQSPLSATPHQRLIFLHRAQTPPLLKAAVITASIFTILSIFFTEL